jgi:hypothetical protein
MEARSVLVATFLQHVTLQQESCKFSLKQQLCALSEHFGPFNSAHLSYSSTHDSTVMINRYRQTCIRHALDFDPFPVSALSSLPSCLAPSEP